MLAELDSVIASVGNRDIPPLTLAGELRDVMAILKGFRSGMVYGAKIRLPHALVMTFLFRSEP